MRSRYSRGFIKDGRVLKRLSAIYCGRNWEAQNATAIIHQAHRDSKTRITGMGPRVRDYDVQNMQIAATRGPDHAT